MATKKLPKAKKGFKVVKLPPVRANYKLQQEMRRAVQADSIKLKKYLSKELKITTARVDKINRNTNFSPLQKEARRQKALLSYATKAQRRSDSIQRQTTRKMKRIFDKLQDVNTARTVKSLSTVLTPEAAAAKVSRVKGTKKFAKSSAKLFAELTRFTDNVHTSTLERLNRELRKNADNPKNFRKAFRKIAAIQTRQVNNGSKTATHKVNAGFNASVQRSLSKSNFYRWKTKADEIVRDAHRKVHNTIQRWDKPPTLSNGRTVHPGEDYNCRCWSEVYSVIKVQK